MAKGFRQAGHAPSLAAALIHFDVSFLCWVLVGALGAYIADDLGLSPTQKGLMVAVPPLGGAGFRLLLGPLSDRVGIKRLGLITLALTLVPLAWGATLATSFGQVLGVGLLLGVAGASFAVALPLASRWYPPEHQGLALGIAGAGNSGTVIAALAAPRLAEHVGWHGTFGLAMLPVALAWVAFALLAKEPPRAAASGASTGGALSLLRDGDPRWLCGFYLNGAVFQLVGRWVPERVGAMTGLVGAAGGLGGFLLPFGFGWLASTTGAFTAGFALLAAVAGLAAFAVAGRDRAWAMPSRPGTLSEAVA